MPNNEKVLPNMTKMMNDNNNKYNNNNDGDNINNNNIDLSQREAIEKLAAFVKQHGNSLEHTVRDRSKNDPKFRFEQSFESTLNINIYIFL